MPQIICDFCGAVNPEWVYPVNSFDYVMIDGETYWSKGGWTACETCAALIDKEDHVSLIDRSMGPYRMLPPGVLKLLRIELEHFHSMFWSNKKGGKEVFEKNREETRKTHSP